MVGLLHAPNRGWLRMRAIIEFSQSGRARHDTKQCFPGWTCNEHAGLNRASAAQDQYLTEAEPDSQFRSIAVRVQGRREPVPEKRRRARLQT